MFGCRETSVTMHRNTSEDILRVNHTEALLIFQKDRLAHVVNLSVIGVCCLVYACKLTHLINSSHNSLCLL